MLCLLSHLTLRNVKEADRIPIQFLFSLCYLGHLTYLQIFEISNNMSSIEWLE